MVPLGLQEPLDVRQQDVTGGEEACAQPQQLPALLLTVPAEGHKTYTAHSLQICTVPPTHTYIHFKVVSTFRPTYHTYSVHAHTRAHTHTHTHTHSNTYTHTHTHTHTLTKVCV